MFVLRLTVAFPDDAVFQRICASESLGKESDVFGSPSFKKAETFPYLTSRRKALRILIQGI